MSNKVSYLALLLSVLSLIVAWNFSTKLSGDVQGNKDGAFERVMKARVLRCAYAAWPPYFVIDPNTKQKSGINYDIMQEIGRVTGLKIEWVEEVGYGAFPNNLREGKEDAFCSGVRQSAARAQRIEATYPLLFAPIYPFVRAGDFRFDGKIEAIDDPNITIAIVDGSTIEAIAKTSFPRARLDALPEMSDAAQVLDDVGAKKADVVFAEVPNVESYNLFNVKKPLRRVANVNPIRMAGSVFAVGKGNWDLRDLLNAAQLELQSDGTIDRVLEKYGAGKLAILSAVKPFSMK